MDQHITAQDGTQYELITGAYLLRLVGSASLRDWEGNRDRDGERVARMKESQLALLSAGRPTNLFMPVPITVCRYQNALLLVDGQHRLAVLQALSREGALDAEGVELLLCVVPCAAAADVEETFVRINAGTPVPAAYYNQRVKRVLDEFLGLLARAHPKAVSAAARPQRPNYNKSRVRDEMSAQIPLRDAIIDNRVTAQRLAEVALAENEIERVVVDGGARRKLPESCLARAAKTGFYLGLREGWSVAVALRAAAP